MLFANSFRNPYLLFFVVFLLNGLFNPAFSQSANYEAAGWNTWFLDKPEEIKLTAPPTAAKSKAELLIIKQRMSKLDDKKREQITYWNAGAPAMRWNQIAPKLMNWNNPDLFLRFPIAWMNVAIYDATILAWKEKVKHKRQRTTVSDASIKPMINAPFTFSYPCEHSVTASAAANVLAYFFPEKADSILQLARSASQSRVDAGVQYPSDVEAGWKMGEQVAKRIIEKAKKDGSDKVWDGKKNTDPAKWTGPYPLGIMLPLQTPMVMLTADQFRPPPPPDFASEMKELKDFKRTFNSTYLAYHWANSGYDYWDQVANKKIFENRLMDDVPAVARIYCILHIASRDAAIATMDAKYAYWGLRPVQYDSTYKPLIATPPFPGYPSGHALGASTAATILSYFFPADAKEFEKLAKDCADSRFYAGIHFRTDNEVGTSMGKELGKYITQTLLKR